MSSAKSRRGAGPTLKRNVVLANRIVERFGLSNAFGHGVTTALPDVRAATVAACMLEESAGMQLRMLAAAGGDAARLRAYSREEAESLTDQISPRVVERAWEYYALAAEQRPLGG